MVTGLGKHIDALARHPKTATGSAGRTSTPTSARDSGADGPARSSARWPPSTCRRYPTSRPCCAPVADRRHRLRTRLVIHRYRGAHPGVRIDGYDLDPPSIASARAHAIEAGVADRWLPPRRAATTPAHRRYDLVTALNASTTCPTRRGAHHDAPPRPARRYRVGDGRERRRDVAHRARRRS